MPVLLAFPAGGSAPAENGGITVRLWNGKRWLSCARLPVGAEAPGSINFLIKPSDLLFLSPSRP